MIHIRLDKKKKKSQESSSSIHTKDSAKLKAIYAIACATPLFAL